MSSRHRTFGLGNPVWSLDPSLTLRRTSAILVNHLFVGCPPQGYGSSLYYTSLPLLPTFWLLLYIFSYRRYFPVLLINSFSVNIYNVGLPMREGELRVFLLHHLAVFLWWLMMFSIFSCACWPSVCLLCKNAYYFLIELFDIDLCEFLNLFWILTPLSDISFSNIFSYSILSHKKEEGGTLKFYH